MLDYQQKRLRDGRTAGVRSMVLGIFAVLCLVAGAAFDCKVLPEGWIIGCDACVNLSTFLSIFSLYQYREAEDRDAGFFWPTVIGLGLGFPACIISTWCVGLSAAGMIRDFVGALAA